MPAALPAPIQTIVDGAAAKSPTTMLSVQAKRPRWPGCHSSRGQRSWCPRQSPWRARLPDYPAGSPAKSKAHPFEPPTTAQDLGELQQEEVAEDQVVRLQREAVDHVEQVHLTDSEKLLPRKVSADCAILRSMSRLGSQSLEVPVAGHPPNSPATG